MKLDQVAIAFDQFVGSIFMNCDADETMSAKLWRCQCDKRRYKVLRVLVDKIFFWQMDHCFESYLAEKCRRQLPASYRSL